MLSGSQLLDVGRFQELRRRYPSVPVEDLGEAILTPGLINAHSHLELSGIELPLDHTPGFTEWAQTLIRTRSATAPERLRERLLAGSRALAASGVTTALDIESTPAAWMESAPETTPIRPIAFPEITGAFSGASPEHLASDALDRARALSARYGAAGLSPHAPYSTASALLRCVATLSPAPFVAMHIAESEDEADLFKDGSGPLADWLAPLTHAPTPTGISPIAHVARSGLLAKKTLVAHGNILSDADVDLLASSGATIVHCPRTHAYFNRAPFHFDRLRAAHIPIALGTDSTSSIGPPSGSPATALSILEEMRRFADAFPEVEPTVILQMVTAVPGEYLGPPARGTLHQHALADLALFDYSGPPLLATEFLVHEARRARVTWIGGVRQGAHR